MGKELLRHLLGFFRGLNTRREREAQHPRTHVVGIPSYKATLRPLRSQPRSRSPTALILVEVAIGDPGVNKT